MKPRRIVTPVASYGPVGLLAAVIVLLTACGKSDTDAQTTAAVPVSVLTVEAKDVPVSKIFVAQTQSSQAVNIQARVSGFLDKRVYTEGSIVKAFSLEELHGASVADIVRALEGNGEQRCLVIDRARHRIRGIIAASAVAKKLRLPVTISKRPTFTDIFESVHRPRHGEVSLTAVN